MTIPRRYAIVPNFEENSGQDHFHHDPPVLCDSNPDQPLVNVVTSLIELDPLIQRATEPLHAPALDIDLPCRLVPSSTPGHFHLFIDAAVPQSAYYDLLDALERCGLVEAGWVRASKVRGYTALRHNCQKEPRP